MTTMRRKDLATAENIAPGLYLVDGDEGDPEGRIVGGPFPDTEAARLDLGILASQLAARTRRPASMVLVANLPA